MKFIADFHIHSHYSVATSKDLTPEHLDYWARRKGITVVGTGDFTHPGWIKELKEKLEPAEDGLFKLKTAYIQKSLLSRAALAKPVRFLLSAEISSIYKKKGKVRKIHNVLFAPDFATVEKIQDALKRIGANITSDGRPILGLDSRHILEIALQANENIFFVPAHIWTPWFSVLGDKAGFDTIEECFDDLAPYIYAVETGLSSDPPMNWMCSFLDRYTLISNSDAHSPEKLGREANIFNTELTYPAMMAALKSADPKHFLGTIEFFPQEGKYHYDGHRKCGVCWNPLETLKHDERCPACGKRVTVGVLHRVAQLSDREHITVRKKRAPFYSLIPLREVLSEITGVGPNTKQVLQTYTTLIERTGSEFDILLTLPLDAIKKSAPPLLAEAIGRMRNGQISIKHGFDGEFGQIKVFEEGEVAALEEQDSLFSDLAPQKSPPQKVDLIPFDMAEYQREKKKHKKYTRPEKHPVGAGLQPARIEKGLKPVSGGAGYKPAPTDLFSGDLLLDLNPEQREAAEHTTGPALILAGPGTGKTRVLTVRIAHLIQQKGVAPDGILAVTFTNKAANEMRERLLDLITDAASGVEIATFHAFGLSIIKEFCSETNKQSTFSLIDENDKQRLLLKKLGLEKKDIKNISRMITSFKQQVITPAQVQDRTQAELFSRYEEVLRAENVFDLDDLLYVPVQLFKNHPQILRHFQERFPWLLIDEYQDINSAQYQLIKLLAPTATANLFVIGDPNQAIYGFRGADVSFINRFMTDYPTSRIYALKQSYRCSDRILQASHNVMNYADTKTTPLAALNEGVKVTIVAEKTDRSEAELVARTIVRMIGGVRFFSIDSAVSEGDEHADITGFSDFVVLCRLARQMPALEKAFHDHGIPYQIVGDEPFFKQEPVRSVLTLLKVLLHPEVEFLKRTLFEKKITTAAQISELSKRLTGKTVVEVLTLCIDTCFSAAKEEHAHVFEEMLTFAQGFGTNSEELLQCITLGTGVDTYLPNTERITVMTLHAAKGLEFNCVFIVGCEDGLLPFSLLDELQCNEDEERRLLYVGMTRAKKFLYLTYAQKRMLFGKTYTLARSPYLATIEQELIELQRSDYTKKAKKEDPQLTLL